MSVQTVTQRTYPQGGTTATHVLGYVGAITRATWRRTPTPATPRAARSACPGSRTSTSSTCGGSPGARTSRSTPAARGRHAQHHRAPERGHGRAQPRHRPAGGGPDDLQQQILADRQTLDASDNLYPPATERRRRRDEPPDRPGARHGLVPDLRPQPVGGRHLARQLHRPAGHRAPRTTTPSRASTPPAPPSSSSPPPRRCRTGSSPGHAYDDTGHYKITGCPAPGVNNDTGCALNDDPGDGGGTTTSRGALTVSSDSFFYNLGDVFWQATAARTATRRSRTGDRLRRGDHHRHRPARRGPGPGRQHLPGPSCTRRHPRPSPTPPWFTGDNIEMAFGQGETVLTPIEQAVAYATFANGGTRYGPRWPPRSSTRDGQGGQEARPEGDRPRGHLAGQLRGHPPGARRAWSRTRTAPPTGPSRASPPRGTSPARRAPPEPGGPRAQRLVRGLRPQPEPPVPRAGGGRPGRLRRPGRRAAGAQHLQLPRGQPGRRRSTTPPRPARRARPRRPPPAAGTPTTTTTTTAPAAGRRPRPGQAAERPGGARAVP